MVRLRKPFYRLWRFAFVLLPILAGFARAEERDVFEEIDVSAGGCYPRGVELHRRQLANWLKDGYDSWSKHVESLVPISLERPKIVRLVWGDVGRSLLFTNLVPGASYDYSVVKDDGTKLSGSFVCEPTPPRTLSVPDGNGGFIKNVRDPNGLVTYAKGSQTVKTENLGGGVVRTWYAQLSDADIRAGANKYLKTTAELELAKAITEKSVVKIDGFAVVDGSMTFKVEVGQDEVAKDAILSKVEISEMLGAGWRNPDADEIGFDETRHEITVTPKSKAVPSQKFEKSFVRVRIPEDK